MSKELNELRERVGPPGTKKDVDVRLHDAVYNFGRAKYLGLDAHLGALCVANDWLDKVTIHVNEKTGKRTFKLPFIQEGQKIKMPEAGKLKELDKQAFEYWNKKHPSKVEPKTPHTPEDPKSPKLPGSQPEKPGTPQKPEAGQGKSDDAVSIAKKVAQDLQTDLMRRQTELDKGIGSIFGHGADAWENIFGHGSNSVKKDLNEKQTQIKAMGKYAIEGNLDEFGKVHKAVTGTEFDPSKRQTPHLYVEKEFQDFHKFHVGTVENLTEIATVGANWGLMAYMGKAKGLAGLAKQALLMTGFGGAVKAGLKGIEHGNMNTGADDFRTGAISGFGFFAADKITHNVASKIHGQSFKRAIFRGAVSGAAGGGTYGAIETPNMGYAHASNEGRKYDAGNTGHDAIFGFGAGSLTGAALGSVFGAATWRRPIRDVAATQVDTPPPVETPLQKLGTPPKQTETPPQAEAPKQTETPPQTEAPKPQTEAPKPQADAPQPQAEAPKQTDAPPPSDVPHNLSLEVIDRAKLAARALCESSGRDWTRQQTLMLRDMARMCHPDAHVGSPKRLAAAEAVLKKLGTLRDLMQGKNNRHVPSAQDIAKAKEDLLKVWSELENLI